MIPARPTIYRGIQMRSRLEARVAAWFDRYKIPWVYEPLNFGDQHGQYLPDFEVKDFGVGGRPKRPLYIEVKPTWELADQWRLKMETIWASDPSADLLVLAPGYLDFAFGRIASANRTRFGSEVLKWVGDWGGWRPDPTKLPAEAGTFHQCAKCEQVTLTISIDSFACARCGYGDGDHHLLPLVEDNRIVIGPIPYESGEGNG